MRSAAAPFKGPFYYYLAELRKGRSQKYIKRIPKAGGGYKYVYKEHHQGGVGAQEHMKAGAAFKLSFQGQEGHFHIIKAEGDRLIVKHDELHGPDHKGVELTKAELSALLTREHRPALEADAKKKRARVDKMKRETPRHIGLKRAERLAQEAEARAGMERKTPAQDTTERPDNFETMPEDTAQEIKRLKTALEAPPPAEDARATPKDAPYNSLTQTQRLAIDRGYVLRHQTEKEEALLQELERVREGDTEPSPELKKLLFEDYTLAFPDLASENAFHLIFRQGLAYEPYTLKHTQASRADIDEDKLVSHIKTRLRRRGDARALAGSAAITYIDHMRKIELHAADALAFSSTDKQRAAINDLVQQARQKALEYIEDFSEGRPLSRARADLFQLEKNIKKDLDITNKLRELRAKHIKETIKKLSKLPEVKEKEAPTPTPAPDNFETMPEDTAAKASEAAQLLMERINELRNQQSVSISEDEALELDEQILDAQLSLRKLERIERKARRAAAKEQAPQAQPVEPPKAEPVKVEPSEAPAGTKTINVTLTNANQINAFKVVSGAKNIKAQNIQGQEYELTASPQDFENALSDLENIIAWEQSGRGGRRTPNAARVKQYRTLRNKLARAVKNAPLIQEEEAPAPKEQTPRAQLLEAAQINIEDFVQQAPPTKPAPAPVYAHAQNTKKIVDKALSSKPTGIDLDSARFQLPSKGDLKEMLSEKGRLQRAGRELLRFNRPNMIGQQNPDQDILYVLDNYLNGPYVEIEQKRLRDIEKGFKIALRDARGEDLKRVKSEIKRFWREWGGEYVRLQRELVTERTEAEALKKIRPLIPEGALSPKINEMLDRLEQELAERPVSQNEAAHWVFSRETNRATRDNPRQTFRDYLAETAPQTAELPPKGQRTAEDAKRFFGEPRKYEQKTGGAKTRKLVKYERDGFAVQGPASGRGKGLFSVTLNYTQSQLSEARAFTEPSSQVLGVFDTLDEALTAAINQHETRQEQTERLATRTQAQRAEQKRRMLGEQTPRERLIETAREITAPAQTSNPLVKVKKEAARGHLIDILQMTRELDDAELNDSTYKGLAYLQAAMSPQRLANMPSSFSYWGFRQREAGEAARDNTWAREFEKYLLGDNKRDSIHRGGYVNQAHMASFIRESMSIKRLADLKGKEAQIKEIAARFARDSFTEAARIAEAAAHRGKAQIIEDAQQALDYLVDQLKDGKKELENPRRGAPDPEAIKEQQEIIQTAQQAREHYSTRAAQIKAQAFSRSAFLEALKTSTNARVLVEGRPDGVPSRRKVEELVQEAVQSELEQLINQYRQTDPAPLAPILEEAPAVRRLDQMIDQLA
jgi:hypothetical protein